MILVMSLSYSHFVTPVAALALVLGANLGSAINPVLESNREDRAAQRLPIGNLINRIIGCAVVLPFLQPISNFLGTIDTNQARQAADFHTLFNLATAAVFMLPLRCLCGAADPPAAAAQGSPRSGRATLSRRDRAGHAARWRSPPPRGKSSIWATSSRACCARP